MKTQKIIINLNPEEHKEFKKIAEKERRTLGSLGLKALADYVEKLKRVKNAN